MSCLISIATDPDRAPSDDEEKAKEERMIYMMVKKTRNPGLKT